MNIDILIVYYSWHGNTRKIAELIAQATDGQLFELEPIKPYTTDYNAVVNQARTETRKGFKPELKAMPKNNTASKILVGSPNWCSTIAPPLATFLNDYDLKGKIVAPFYTHGGGGSGNIESDIINMCSGSNVVKGFGVYNSGGANVSKQIMDWLTSIGV